MAPLSGTQRLVDVERAVSIKLNRRTLIGLVEAVKEAWKLGVPDRALMEVDWDHYAGDYAVIFKWREGS